MKKFLLPVFLLFASSNSWAQTKVELQRQLMDSITSVLNIHEPIFLSGITGEEMDPSSNGSRMIMHYAEGQQQMDSCLCHCLCYCKTSENSMNRFKMKEVNGERIKSDGETLWIEFNNPEMQPMPIHIENAIDRERVKIWFEKLAGLCAE